MQADDGPSPRDVGHRRPGEEPGAPDADASLAWRSELAALAAIGWSPPFEVIEAFVTGRTLSWERDGQDWPLRAASRFVEAGGLRWHVQVLGRGPVMLLLHGTGAATHTWRDLAPRLAAHGTVVAPDLPGHGFTGHLPPARVSLPQMARGVAALLRALDLPLQGAIGVGHSAGAAVLARMSLDELAPLAGIVSLNGALLPFQGWAGVMFAPMARLMAANPLVPRVFSWRAGDPLAVHRLVRSTGSRIDAHGEALYARLLRAPGHVAGALAMMANWELEPLQADLPGLRVPLLLLAGDHDRTLPHALAGRIAARVPTARLATLPKLGHLAHEEDPAGVAGRILAFLAELQPAPVAG